MNHAELVMRRRNVEAFIEADEVTIVITRPGTTTKNPSTGGTIKGTDKVLKPQKARIVQNVRRYTNGTENAEAGDIPNSEYRLIGLHDMDLKPNDQFKWMGETYRVLPKGIFRARQESILAAIDLLGPDNRGS